MIATKPLEMSSKLSCLPWDEIWELLSPCLQVVSGRDSTMHQAEVAEGALCQAEFSPALSRMKI